LTAAEDLIWHIQVPLKVFIFVLRLLRDRLPKKANLVTRDIISQEAQYCVPDCGCIESAQHLLFTCGTFGSLWTSVQCWIDYSSVDHQNPSDHLIQFVDAAGGGRARRSFLKFIWLVSVWVLWNERNHRLFSHSAKTLSQHLDKVKIYSFWWLKTTNVTLVTILHSWWSNPMLCLEIDRCCFIVQLIDILYNSM
jgi:hypothetical protein